MELHDAGDRLTWCTNLFPSGNLQELLALIRGPALRVKAALGWERAMGLGLWLPGQLAATLARDSGALETVQAALAEGGFWLQTVNCFPMGRFHGAPVKQAVYLPDWSSAERLSYTENALSAAARLCPPGRTLSLSTVPLGLAGGSRAWEEACADRLLQAAHMAADLERTTGKDLVLVLEPEPGCRLERGDEAAAWLAAGAKRLSGADAQAWKRRIGLCLDACHMAVLGEDPAAALLEARQVGVRVAKLQLSSALELAPVTEAGLQALEAFVEPIYCHQSSWLDDQGRLVRSFLDLDQALAASRSGLPGIVASLRAHFHLPLFWEGKGTLVGTACSTLPGLLARKELLPEVLEVETYTWSILPGDLGGSDLAQGVARELQWVLDLLA